MDEHDRAVDPATKREAREQYRHTGRVMLLFIVEVMTPLVLYIQQNMFFVKSNKLNIA